MATFNPNELKRKLREAQRKAEQQVKREIDRVNRVNRRAVDDYNRKAEAHNKRVIDNLNRDIRQQNQRVATHNRQLIADLNRQLRSTSSTVRYTESERVLADRVHEAVASLDSREYDVFLSYAQVMAVKLQECFKISLKV